MLGAAAFGGAAQALVANTVNAQTPSDGLTQADIDLLNFVLNIEYLQAELYTKVTTGLTIAEVGVPVSGIGTPGPTIGGAEVQLTFANDPRDISLKLARDDQRHVRVLRNLLRTDAIAKPEMNLDALGAVNSLKPYMWRARQFEDLLLSAYDGIAPSLESKTALSNVMRLALVEGEHTGYMRFFSFITGFGSPIIDSHDVLPPPSGTNFFSDDSLSLAVLRTPSEVLAFLYHNITAGTLSGGFFPQGVNGPINTV